MAIDRRRLLGLLGAGVAGPAAARAAAQGGASDFRWGVASGDPLTDRVILWSAVASPGPVAWEVARDPAFTRLVRRGATTASRARDLTVKVDVTGLKPGTEYFYRFRKGRDVSPIGRTRTLPVGPVKDVVLAFATCALIPAGYFNAYQAIADLTRVDAVVHLGDYIYEYGAGPNDYGMNTPTAAERAPQPPHDCVSLSDYRTRHAQYRRDPQLQAAHARAPWIVVWDDHETANDSWRDGAQNHRPDEGAWDARKAAAIKAYYEWMPIREPKGGGFAIWRSFDFGDLASLFMLETRLTARDQQVSYADLPAQPTPADLAAFRARIADPARKMMSAGQEAWLEQGMASSARSGRTWQVLGNQVLLGRISPPAVRRAVGDGAFAKALENQSAYAKHNYPTYDSHSDWGLPLFLDSWDGYTADRARLYALIERSRARCLAVSGDSHMFWANELYDQPEGGRLAAVEFGTTGITSPGAGDEMPGLPVGELFEKRNREVRYCDAAAKGFVLMTLTRQAALAEYIAVSTVFDHRFEARVLKRYRVTPKAAGVSGLSEA